MSADQRCINRLPEPFTGYVFHDFEYRDSIEQGITLVCGCFLHTPSGEWVVIDFRQPDGAAQLASLQERWKDCAWFSYSARAEMTCFLLCGLSIDHMHWIDLMVEARQITGTHYHFHARRAGLLFTLQALGIESRGEIAWKEIMRLLILENETYTDEQFDQIVDYCASDIEPLPKLWNVILQVHNQRQGAMQPIVPFQTSQAIYRADYLKALSKLEHRSPGFPIDEPWMDRIYRNHQLIRREIAKKCNAEYGADIFRYVKVSDSFALSDKNLDAYVQSLPFPIRWPRTPTGKLLKKADFLSDFSRENPHFKPLNDTMILLSQLKGRDLRKLVHNGFIRGGSIPFYTVTSRNQPLISDGYLFNLPHWLRSLCRPKPHHVLIGCDYAQQEVVIGASLSGDRTLAAALFNQDGSPRDVYIALAQMAGVITDPHATKKTHPTERASFKSVQFGIGYGMGIVKLGYRLYLDLRAQGVEISIDEATERAADIHRWHKETFRDYWSFINREVAVAREQGWTRATDGWTYFANLNSSFTKLQNFHQQANAAVMLREAIKLLADEPDVKLVCSQHDSIFLYCHEDDQVVHENHLRRSMGEACRYVLANTKLPLMIHIPPPEIYTHETGYRDDDGKEMLDFITDMLDRLGV